jgi:hypothetical protein
LPREKLKPLQLIPESGNALPIDAFNKWGTFGISAMAIHPQEPMLWFIATTAQLWTIHLSTGDCRQLPVSGLEDIHELTIQNDILWLANSGNDEIIGIDLNQYTEVQRYSLSKHVTDHGSDHIEDHVEIAVVDRFHINQAFRTHEGELYGLVHHITGKQITRTIASRVLKHHGEGGVIDIETGRRHHLKLRAPHSVRLTEDGYWLCDSAHGGLNHYAKDWTLTKRIPIAGFGRGAVLSEDSQVMHVGISPKRKRYVGPRRGLESQECSIATVDLAQGSIISKTVISAVEQINNIYCITNEQADALRSLALNHHADL